MLVHSFGDAGNGFSNFREFAHAMGIGEAKPGSLVGPALCEGVSLYLGWVQDEAPKGATPSVYLDDLHNYASRLSEWCDRVRAGCDKRQSAMAALTVGNEVEDGDC